MKVTSIFNVLTFLTKLNVFTISRFSLALLSIIVDMVVFFNKTKESKLEGDTLLTIVLASFGSIKNGKRAEAWLIYLKMD